MPSLDKRMTKIEDAVAAHLIQSGGIKADLQWLKRFMWFVLGSPILVEVVRHIWK